MKKLEIILPASILEVIEAYAKEHDVDAAKAISMIVYDFALERLGESSPPGDGEIVLEGDVVLQEIGVGGGPTSSLELFSEPLKDGLRIAKSLDDTMSSSLKLLQGLLQAKDSEVAQLLTEKGKDPEELVQEIRCTESFEQIPWGHFLQRAHFHPGSQPQTTIALVLAILDIEECQAYKFLHQHGITSLDY